MTNILNDSIIELNDIVVIRDIEGGERQDVVLELEAGSDANYSFKLYSLYAFKIEFVNNELQYVGQDISYKYDNEEYYIYEIFRRTEENTYSCIYRKEE